MKKIVCCLFILSFILFPTISWAFFFSSPEDKVKEGYLEFDKSSTIENVFSGYQYSKSVKWSSFKDKQKRTIVEARINYNLVDEINATLNNIIIGRNEEFSLTPFRRYIEWTRSKEGAGSVDVYICIQFAILDNDEFKMKYIGVHDSKDNKIDVFNDALGDVERIQMINSIYKNEPLILSEYIYKHDYERFEKAWKLIAQAIREAGAKEAREVMLAQKKKEEEIRLKERNDIEKDYQRWIEHLKNTSFINIGQFDSYYVYAIKINSIDDDFIYIDRYKYDIYKDKNGKYNFNKDFLENIKIKYDSNHEDVISASYIKLKFSINKYEQFVIPLERDQVEASYYNRDITLVNSSNSYVSNKASVYIRQGEKDYIGDITYKDFLEPKSFERKLEKYLNTN